MSGRMIVLSGLAGAGKDSIADVLVKEHGFEKFALSRVMKTFCKNVFGWSDDQVFGPSYMRNEPDPRWTRPCSRCNGTGSDCRKFPIEGCHDCQGDGTLNDNSPRRILQLLGDEWGRQMIHPDVWTMSARKELDEHMQLDHNIVVVDARFQNDRNNLRDWFGARRVDVRNLAQKEDVKTETWRSHGSETDQPSDDAVDFVLEHAEHWPFVGLHAKVEDMVSELWCDDEVRDT